MINKAIIIGNVGADPELKHTQNGLPVVNVSVATSESWKDQNTGEWKEKTEWHKVVAWGKMAENFEQKMGRGDTVYIEGSIETSKWTDSDGIDRYTTQIKAKYGRTLIRRSGKSGNQAPEPPPDAYQHSMGDDVPF